MPGSAAFSITKSLENPQIVMLSLVDVELFKVSVLKHTSSFLKT